MSDIERAKDLLAVRAELSRLRAIIPDIQADQNKAWAKVAQSEQRVADLTAIWRELDGVPYGGGDGYVVVPRTAWERIAAALAEPKQPE